MKRARTKQIKTRDGRKMKRDKTREDSRRENLNGWHDPDGNLADYWER